MRKEVMGHLLGLATISIWGSTYIVSKIVLETFLPTQVLLMRFIVASIVLTIICPKFEKVNDIKQVVLTIISAICLAGYFLCENTALTYTYATNVSLIVATIPILSLILSGIFDKREKFSKLVIIGSVIAYAGVVVIVMGGGGESSVKLLGDIIALMAAVSFAVYSLALSKVNGKDNTIKLTRNVFYYVTVVILISNIVKGNLKAEVFPIEKLLDGSMIISLLFLGVMASSLSFIMWNQSIKYIGSTSTNKYIYFGPVITAVIAAIFLNERITLIVVIGAVMIIGGVYLSEIKVKKPERDYINEYITKD